TSLATSVTCCYAPLFRSEVHGVFTNIADHFHRQRRHTALGITHCCRAVITWGAEVTLAINHWVTHIPWLRQTHQRVINSRVTVWVEMTHGICNWTRRLHIAALRTVARVIHRIQNATVYWL